ncbi:hypothetical protein DAMA08_003890 [Martiniozyma asiatica (nom. inval.)]|nr:hypothetical protein DAMA08_003890 [Martiniozyma asiatica]
MGFVECYKRLKWGIFPVRRIVDEDTDMNYEDLSDETEVEESKAVSEIEYEYRDEANRKWWNFFNEWEYRTPKHITTRKTVKWYHWFDPNDTPAERKLIIKLDILLTFYSMMAYWVKYLDQSNLNNAYVAGLKESIGMKGNDLVNTQIMFSIGNVIFQIPFMYILVALPLNYVLPGLDIVWSILTIVTAFVHDVPGLKAIRFFIGACESGNYLAYMFLFGAFYTHNISIRSMCYYLGQYLGILTSGLLSGAIVRNFKGVHGLEAWQWIFIFDGIISVIVGLLGVYMLPGTPDNCYSIWLSDDEIRLLRKKLKRNHTAGSPDNHAKSFFDLKLWKEIFSSWQIYVLSLWNILCWCNSNGASGAYVLWLKSLKKVDSATGHLVAKFGAGELQDYTALTPGLGLLWLILVCGGADLFKSRWGAIIISQVFNLTGNVILAVWDVPEGAKWFAWCLQYFGWAMAPVLYSWQNDICRRDSRKRVVVLVTMNILAQTTTVWTSVLVWKTVEAPRYLKGYSFTAASAFGLSIWTIVVLWFYKRQEKHYSKQNGIILYNSKENPDFLTNLESEKSVQVAYDPVSEKEKPAGSSTASEETLPLPASN